MGKINDKMRKSRENITNDVEPISQEVIHEHVWHFIRQIEMNSGFSLKFGCECGAVKYPPQFEVEE